MSCASSGGGNPASVASSASTIITVEQPPVDENELYASLGLSMRRPKTDADSPISSSAPGSPLANGERRNGRPADDSINDLLSDPNDDSISSSVRAYIYEGGIRYHAYRDGKYALPNDEIEQNRDDMKHSMTLLLCHGAHFLAPVQDALRDGGEVLDLGTGTGMWAIGLGDKYPNAKITGIDLSPIQPDWVPENVHFFIDDFTEDWDDPPNQYDYIHIRYTLFSVRDREALYRRALRHLKPGGYIEFQELEYWPKSDDDTLTPEKPYALRDYIEYFEQGMRILGSEIHAIRSLPEELRNAGFDDVQTKTYKCPLGVWPREKRLVLCGLFLRTAFMDGLYGVSRRPMTALGWTPLQLEMFLVEVRKAMMDPKFHVYMTFHVVYGRKPIP